MCYPFRQGTLGTGRVAKLMDQESLWLLIPTISTKRTITSYHNSLNTKWGTTPYGIINNINLSSVVIVSCHNTVLTLLGIA
jgi:hypothetical protein